METRRDYHLLIGNNPQSVETSSHFHCPGGRLTFFLPELLLILIPVGKGFIGACNP